MSTPKVYYYTDEEVGLPWPGPDADRVEWCKSQGIPHPRFIWYEWPGFEETTDPRQATAYVVRQRLYGLTDEIIESLPYYKDDARHRHVFLGLGPDGGPKAFRSLARFPGIFFRACVNHGMLVDDPDIISWPWPVLGVGEYAALPPGGFKYDAAFQGQVTGPTELVISSIEQASLKSHVVRIPGFFSVIRYAEPEKAAKLRISYLESMQASRVAVCPNSNPYGAIRYRFYEAMSMGRVSLFIGDGCVLPLSDKIAWQHCVVQIANRDMPKAGEFLERWLSQHDDAEITAMGIRAREAWNRWLKRENWGIIIGELVRERLEI